MKYKILLSTILLIQTTQTNNLLFVDTFCNKQFSYNNFTAILKNTGFNIEYINFYDLKNKEVDNYDSLFLLTSPAFFENMDQSQIAQDVIEKINYFVHLKNKLLGLIVPNITNNEDAYSVKELIKYTNMLSFKTRGQFTDILSWFLLFPIYKKLNYKTIFPVSKEKPLTNEDIQNIPYVSEKNNLLNAAVLPINNDFSKLNFPFGLYIKNGIYNNHFFISKIPTMFFSEISEDFRINPIDHNIKLNMLEAVSQTFSQLKIIIETQNLECVKKQEKNNLPEKLKNKFSVEYQNLVKENIIKDLDNNNYDWVKNGINAGWIDLEAFDTKVSEKTVNNIINANLNLLWIRINPEQYFSKIATGKNKEIYLQRISQCTKIIKETYEKLNKELPKIFIGFEITNNFKTQPVNDSMFDIYQKNYSKIPAPFDFENFWKIELLDVIDEFYNEWQNTLSNGLNIDGIFLDFEMYHAQDQESSYPGISDFSYSTWQTYHGVPEIKNIKKRISYLNKNNLFNDYFNNLENQAFALGKTIKNYINTKLPNAIIAVYMPLLPNTWFYTGLLSGLSLKDEPIILATFNNDFFANYEILEKNNIYALHIAVILLSKFKSNDDFKDIDELKKFHNGIWYNRFSWLSYPYENNKWWSVEASALEADVVIKEIALRTLNNEIK